MRALVLMTLLTMTATAGAQSGSLFSDRAEARGTLISERKAKFQPGDIITILVRETIDAQTQSNTNTKKESDISANAPIAANPFLVQRQPDGLGIINPGELPNWQIDIENEHRTQGRTQRNNRLATTIAARVVRTEPNGVVHIEGTKRVTVNREDSLVRIRGAVRERDVTSDNTVLSTQVADAEIELQGKGPLWNNQRRGIITRFLDWFSPF